MVDQLVYMAILMLYDNCFKQMVIKVHSNMSMTFDIEDHISILFIVVDNVEVHIKHKNPM